jgi:hypothetical protein
MVMVNKKIFLIIFVILLFTQFAYVDALSVSLKRTNPGIAGIKSSEIIFDIVNMDIDNQIEGFILCRSPDDILITSSLGLGSGSGAQYVSPLFEMNKGPSQKAVYLTVSSNYKGDYSTNCILKYIPFKIINEEKVYIRMNLDEIKNPNDSDYREIRLNKNILFISSEYGYVSAYCPQGKSTCKTDEIIISSYKPKNNIFKYLTIIMIFLIGIMLIYILKKKI